MILAFGPPRPIYKAAHMISQGKALEILHHDCGLVVRMYNLYAVNAGDSNSKLNSGDRRGICLHFAIQCSDRFCLLTMDQTTQSHTGNKIAEYIRKYTYLKMFPDRMIIPEEIHSNKTSVRIIYKNGSLQCHELTKLSIYDSWLMCKSPTG